MRDAFYEVSSSGTMNDREQSVRRFDELGHLFSLLVGRHILRWIVREIGVAGWIPVIELDSFGPIERVGGNGKCQSQDLQCLGDFLRDGVIGHAQV